MKLQYLYSFLLFFIEGIWCQVTDEEYGKLPPVFSTDNFDTCMMLGEQALYCTIEFKLQPNDRNNISMTWKNIQALSRNPKNYHHNILRHGICIPVTCPSVSTDIENISQFENELSKCYSEKYVKDGLNGEITNMHCQSHTNSLLDEYDILMITFLTIYLIFVLYATMYAGITKNDHPKVTGTLFAKMMTSFSIASNFYRLRTIKETEDMKSLKAIQGIRFLNMFLVIACHNILVTFAGPVSNTRFMETLTDKFENIFFASGGYAVQTFFLISAWLLSYHVFLMFEKEKKFNVKALFWVFVNRYVRLTPTLAVVLGLHVTFLRHATRGPFWDKIVGEEFRNCRKNGWTNLLYINNYVNSAEMCIQQTWYLAADTQLFILGLVILGLVKTWQNKMKLILATSLIIGISIPGIMAYINSSDVLSRAYPEVIYNLYLQDENWHLLFISGYSNIGVYVIGIIFGFLYYTNRNVRLPTTTIHSVLWYILSFGLGLSIIAISYPMYDSSYVYSRISSALYWSFGKNIFSLAIAIGIFGFTQKLGWLCRWICCWNPFVILGRLTYSAYLIHSFVLRIRASSLRHPIYVDRYIFVIGTVGDMTMTYLYAFLLCILFEMPISALQKMWIPQKAKMESNPLKESAFPKIVVDKEDH